MSHNLNKNRAVLTRCPTCSQIPRCCKLFDNTYYVGCCNQSQIRPEEVDARIAWNDWAMRAWDRKDQKVTSK